jgi:hypothetical protein
MITNKTFTVLPFYDDVEKQWHRVYDKPYDLFPLICPTNRLLPFEIKRSSDPALVLTIYLVDLCTGSEIEITDDIPGGDILINTAGGYDYIQCVSAGDLDAALDCGYYYLKAYFTAGKTVAPFYSEVFQVVNFEDSTVHGITWNDTDLVYVSNSNTLTG